MAISEVMKSEKTSILKRITFGEQHLYKARRYVVTGDIIEEYEYQFLTIRNDPVSKVADAIGEYREKNYQSRQRERRNNVRRLVSQNFTSMDKFVTLTFKECMTDVAQANNEFRNFTRRLKRNYCDLKYLSVIEFQERGAVHYHMICNLPYVPVDELRDLWGNGFVFINAIDHVDNVGAYVVKYMTKDTDDKRLQGKMAYLCSKGLLRPHELRSWEAKSITGEDRVRKRRKELDELIKGKVPVYTSTKESEYCGTITYRQYNLKRKT